MNIEIWFKFIKKSNPQDTYIYIHTMLEQISPLAIFIKERNNENVNLFNLDEISQQYA